MRLAWFRPAAADDRMHEDLLAVVDELRATHAIDLIDEPKAHDFVWRHARHPYDLCVYELADTVAHQFIWPYLLHVPGVVALRALSMRTSRADALAREQRSGDYRAELAFSGWPMLRAPLLASRLVVVFDTALARTLEHEYAGVQVEVAVVGVRGAGVRFGVLDGTSIDLVQRAARRARDAGAAFELVVERPIEEAIHESDVAIALEWPPSGTPLTSALLAMASARACVIHETEVHAAWPALDPQNWQPRDRTSSAAPIAVSIDPRDDEHSLALAMRRLSSDAALRDALGRAAQAWWRAHATIEQAAAAWRGILERAVTLDPPRHPDAWPPHLTADGTERACELLAEFGVSVDILQKPSA